MNAVWNKSVVVNLLRVWLLFGIATSYVSVPLVHAALISLVLTIQASLGIAILERLVELPRSLLAIIGPGLILGSATSVGVFQLVGRGTPGIAIALVTGIVSIMKSKNLRHVTSGGYVPVAAQLIGLALLAFSTEHPELIPIALTLLGAGFLLNPGSSSRFQYRIRFFALATLCIGIASVSAVLRDQYWWLMTDDYQHIEIIMRHVTESGPFADWGIYNYGTSYHWLSNAWAGLLNEYLVNPSPFVTTTRVMPVVYSISLAASLVLAAQWLSPSHSQRLPVLAAGTVLASINLDWSGISTGGIYAVLAASVCVGLLAIGSASRWTSKILACVVFVPIIVLTKAPSIVAILTFFSCYAVALVSLRLRGRITRLLGMLLSIGAAIALGTSIIALMSHLSHGRLRLATSNPALGQISTLEPVLVFVLSSLQYLWLLVPVGLLSWFLVRRRDSDAFTLLPFIPTIWTVIIGGILIQVTVVTNADNFRYFSGPMMFLGSLIFFCAPSMIRSWGDNFSPRDMRLVVVSYLVIVSLGIIWNWGSSADYVWNEVLSVFPESFSENSGLLAFVTRDIRFGGLLVAALLTVALARIKQSQAAVFVAFLAVLASGPAVSAMNQMWYGFGRTRTELEIESLLGSQDARKVGLWLRSNSEPESLVATNDLVELDGDLGDDFSLAVWSEREFLVIGPRFHVGNPALLDPAFQLSMSFMSSINGEVCSAMRDEGVTWFIENTNISGSRTNHDCAIAAHTSGRFTVWRLDYTSHMAQP